MDMDLGKLQEMVKDREAWGCSPWGHKEWDMTWWLNNNSKVIVAETRGSMEEDLGAEERTDGCSPSFVPCPVMEMATHSSIIAWRIPWTEEPGGLTSMGSQNQTRLSDYHFHLHFFTVTQRGARRYKCRHHRALDWTISETLGDEQLGKTSSRYRAKEGKC